jgi:toxin ParE1/3/4
VRLVWTNAAEADRDGIYDYIEADNPRAAIVLDDRFRAAAARLPRFPHMGRPGRVDGTREFVAHKNYILVYEIEGETLRILRVLHASRLWPPE